VRIQQFYLINSKFYFRFYLDSSPFSITKAQIETLSLL
jgi:hypothetical protein